MVSLPLNVTFASESGDSRRTQDSIPLVHEDAYCRMSDEIPVTGMWARIVHPDKCPDLIAPHCAPADQFILQLQGGAIKVVFSDKQFDIMQPPSFSRVQDVTGKGHESIPLTSERRISLFLPVKPHVSKWLGDPAQYN